VFVDYSLLKWGLLFKMSEEASELEFVASKIFYPPCGPGDYTDFHAVVLILVDAALRERRRSKKIHQRIEVLRKNYLRCSRKDPMAAMDDLRKLSLRAIDSFDKIDEGVVIQQLRGLEKRSYVKDSGLRTDLAMLVGIESPSRKAKKELPERLERLMLPLELPERFDIDFCINAMQDTDTLRRVYSAVMGFLCCIGFMNTVFQGAGACSSAMSLLHSQQLWGQESFESDDDEEAGDSEQEREEEEAADDEDDVSLETSVSTIKKKAIKKKKKTKSTSSASSKEILSRLRSEDSSVLEDIYRMVLDSRKGHDNKEEVGSRRNNGKERKGRNPRRSDERPKGDSRKQGKKKKEGRKIVSADSESSSGEEESMSSMSESHRISGTSSGSREGDSSEDSSSSSSSESSEERSPSRRKIKRVIKGLKETFPTDSISSPVLMSTLGDIIISKGIVIMDSIGQLHKVGLKKQKGTKFVRLSTELIKGPKGKENPTVCGPKNTCQAIFPVSWDHFRAFEVEQNNLLMLELSKTRQASQRDKIMKRVHHVSEYFEQFRRRMLIVMGTDHSLSHASEHHVTRWSVLVYFHLVRWQTAMLSGNFKLLHQNLQRDFTSMCQDKLEVMSGSTQQRIEYSLKFLGYCCPRPGCGAPGFCEACCPHCGRGACFSKKQSTSKSASKKSFDIAWEKWKQTTSNSDKSREAFRKTNPTIPSNTAQSASTGSDEIVSEFAAWEWLQTHQTVIVPPRAPSKFD